MSKSNKKIGGRLLEQQLERFSHLRHAAHTDVGQKRTNNEDAFGVFPNAGIFCVSDGMGGGDDGEVASAATVKAIGEFCEAHPLPKEGTYQIDDLVTGLRYAVNSASAWIYKRAQERNLKGCGATFVGVCFDASNPMEAVALHAGDSRLYRIRGRSIQQITKDHSAAELIGAKNEKDVNPMFRGMILRAVGIQSSVEVERTPLPVKAGDRILICSDGLSRMVPDKKLLSISRANADVDEAAAAMIVAANDAGGIDNVTAVLIEIGQLPAPLVAFALPGLPSEEDADISRGGGHASRDADSSGTADSDSAAGFVSSDGIGSDDSATATNTSATFSNGDVSNAVAIATVCTTVSGEPMVGTETREDANCLALREKARRQRRVRIFITTLLAILLLGAVGNVIFHRKKLAEAREHAIEIAQAKQHAQEVARLAEERLVHEKAVAEERIRIERKKAAELRAKQKADKEQLVVEKAKAEAAALDAKRKIEEAQAARKKAEDERRCAREKAAAEALAAQKSRRDAEAAVATALEAKRKAEEKAAAEAAAAMELKKKEEARRVEDERRAARHKVMLETLIAACALDTVGPYAEKLHALNCDGVLDDLSGLFRDMRSPDMSFDKKKALAVEITRNVQKSVRQLQDYAQTELAGLEVELNGADNQRKDLLEAQIALRRTFLDEAGRFLEIPAESPIAHGQCGRMIHGIPGWFR